MVTLDDWIQLPEQPETLIEVVAGELIQLPRPPAFHQLAVNRLTYWLDERLALPCSALAQVEMVVAEAPLTVRVPDVVVVPAALVETNPARLAASEARLVIEVLSEGSKRTDRVMKHFEYAEAGIRHYWIVDLDPPVSMITYRP
jgi:Uma2 family endonuclease